MKRILEAIMVERDRQDAKWGSGKHLPSGLWSLVLLEEAGEAARAAMRGNRRALMAELVQVAAVAVAWIEDIDGAASGSSPGTDDWVDVMVREAFEEGRKATGGKR